ncbi:MAG: hypothetical protein PHT33_10790 [bacterium]|nr:hypothetical protein [bacterium]
MRSVIEFLLIFTLLMGIASLLHGPDWRTVGIQRITANSSQAWDIAKQYHPRGMDIRDYCDRVVEMNGRINAGEQVFVPVCEVGR